jgi:Uma2 family endonuclease
MTQAWPPLLDRTTDAPRREVSLEEWLSLPEDEPGELVEGILVEEEVPDAVHELAVSWLIRVLGGWLPASGFVFGSELKFSLGPRRGRKPDVTVFLPGRPAPPRRGALTKPPDIAIEVVTASPRDERRDRVEKLDEYAAFGVRFYWILDPALGSLEIFELGSSGRYARASAATQGVMDPVPGCPELTLDLDGLWAELGRLGAEE